MCLHVGERVRRLPFFRAVVEGAGFESCVGFNLVYLFIFFPSVALFTVGVGGHEYY